MPIREIMILRKGGMPLFNFAPAGAPKLDALVAGFLSAQAGFAEEIGEGKIQVVSFAENKFVYESRADLLFIIVISQEDDENIYRVILKEIAKSFEKKYTQILAKSVLPSHLFDGFRAQLMEILNKYDKIPKVQPRYPSAILPPEISQEIEQLLHQIESSPGILRAALLTNDGYLVSSKLQSHEIELAAKQLQQSRDMELPTYFGISQTVLDEGTKLFVHIINDDLVLMAIVRKDQIVSQIADAIEANIQLLATLDLSSMVKVSPKTKGGGDFSEFDVFTANPILESALFAEGTPSAREFQRLFGEAGISILQAIDGVSTIAELRIRAGVNGRQFLEVLNYLTAKGYIRKVLFYPKIDTTDKRFLTYLETVGLPRDEFQILEQAKHFCDGHNSIRDISLRIGVDYKKLIKTLRKLGEYVEWLT